MSSSYQENSLEISDFAEGISNYIKNNCDDYAYYAVVKGLVWGATSMRMVFDIAVTYKSHLIAVFEYVDGDHRFMEERRLTAPYVFQFTEASLFVCYIRKSNKFKVCLKETPNQFEEANYTQIKRMICKYAKSNIESSNSKNDAEQKNKLVFYESTEKILDPIWCREQLTTNINEYICRYTSLESLFSVLKFKTLRMNGLPGMNDRNEGLFAWDMIYRVEKTKNEEYKKRKSEINNVFIVSFSAKKLIDDLNQWRLYGDDAKGVCCVYKVLNEKLKDRFFLHEVRYIHNNKNEEVPDELLRRFKDYSESQSRLSYYDLSPAIFFYKPDDFRSEDEIRLLVDNKKTSAYKTDVFKREWLLTNANRIPNPYIDVPLEDIPLKLERIILGPNMVDVDTIQVQLETILLQQGIEAKVELSEVRSYRNPTNY